MTFDLDDSEITNSKWSHKTHKIVLVTDSSTTSEYELAANPIFFGSDRQGVKLLILV